MDTSPNVDGLKIGPINVNLQQLSVGIITNLIVFPPSFLLVQIFKRSKRRYTRLTKMKKLLEEHNPTKNQKDNDEEKRINEENENDFEEEKKDESIKTKNKKYELKFPWWFKFVAYALSFVFATVCLFFVLMKGITFGNETVTKWITSVVISFLTSVLLTQPLQVNLKKKKLFDN